jgi:integrase
MPPKPPRVSTYYRADRNKWCIRYREPGTLRQRQTGTYTTREEAEEAAVHKRRELRDPFSQARETLSVGQLLARYYDEHLTTGGVKNGTQDNYTYHLGKILETPIVSVPATELTTSMVNVWSKNLGESPSTTRNMITVLSGAYKHAMENGISSINENPVRYAKRPEQRRERIIIPSTETIMRLAMTAPGPSEKWRAGLMIAALCGLRQQELFALEWQHITPTKILVRQAVSGQARKVGKTKTEKGIREVPLMPFVHDTLEAWREWLQPSADEPLVFPNQRGAPYATSNFTAYIIGPWRKQAGVDIKWRHLRHFYVSYLLSLGVEPYKISRYAGHSSYAFTVDRYGFLFADDHTDIVERMETGISSW